MDTLSGSTHDIVTVEDIKAAIDQSSRIGALELNVDFTQFLDPSRFNFASLSWTKPPYLLYQLRSVFRSHPGLLQKVQTKAYLTDRRQTGGFPSNREARWEISPNSPQFATFRNCTLIEAKLLAQILEFSNAPLVQLSPEAIDNIGSLTGIKLAPGMFRCPISGERIDYSRFIKLASAPEHGRSPFQVGHIIPLAHEKGHHVYQNTSWITELGNRVQGEDALDDIVNKIFEMAAYHKERLGLGWQEIEGKLTT